MEHLWAPWRNLYVKDSQKNEGNIFAEIGEVVAGTKSGRESDEEITLFKSVGVAVEDIVAADLVWRRYLATERLRRANRDW